MTKWDSEFGIIDDNKRSYRRERPSNIERNRMRRKKRRRRRRVIDMILVALVLVLATHCFICFSKTDAESINMTEDKLPDNFPVGELDDIETEYPRVMLINKEHGLPKDYVPSNMVKANVKFGDFASEETRYMTKEAAIALENLFNAASSDGMMLVGVSAYRSYATQDAIYKNNVATKGEAYSSIYSAKAGKSEHQAGVAIDLSTFSLGGTLSASFGESAEGKWLSEHCADYGYIVRYTRDKTDITGYAYEPWHIRYVGVEVAKIVTERGIALEEYEGAVDYQSFLSGGLLKTEDEVSADAESTTEASTELTRTNTVKTIVTTEAPRTENVTTEAKKDDSASNDDSKSDKKDKTKTTEATKSKTTEATKTTEASKTTEAAKTTEATKTTESSSNEEANADDAEE
ncbi:MAG: M15 family metallopeptidase [Lachnospiraceae bacterium]|nr:M15 family metallopeptidase [Lachnospiraceae bacterium]